MPSTESKTPTQLRLAAALTLESPRGPLSPAGADGAAAFSPRSREALGAAGGAIDADSPADLVRALEHYKALGGVSAFCLRAIAVLAAGTPSARVQKELLAAACAAAAVRTMFAYPARPDVAHYGSKALANMAAWGGGWEAVLAAGGASAAVAAIAAHGGGEGGGGGGAAATAAAAPAPAPASAPVLHYACKALAAATWGPAGGDGGCGGGAAAAAARPGRDAVVLAGGLRALFSVASAPCVSDEALYYAVKGAVPLASPAAPEELRARVLAMGWPGLVVGVLRGRGGAQLALATVGLRFLAAMSRSHSGGRSAVLAGGGAALVVGLLGAVGARSAGAAAAGIAVLSELVDGTAPEVAQLAASGAVKAIVAAMTAHEGAEGYLEVARAGCGALAHCAVFLRDETRAAGAMQAVERAEAYHAGECAVLAREARRAIAVKEAPGTTPLISSFAPRPPPF
jgi:hypothetical protein